MTDVRPVDPDPKEHIPIREDVARLYRAEAIEQYQRGERDEANLLEIEPRWTRYAYRILLALIASALAFSALVHVERSADGWGVVRDGRVVAFVPARDRAQLRAGQVLRFEHASEPLTLTAVRSDILAATDARRLLGADGARLWTSTEPAVRVEAKLGGRFGDGVTGRVRVQLGRERLLLLWVRRG